MHSVPVGPGRGGGDVQYVSVCPNCIVSRIALADVSGHGEAVEIFGEKLKHLMNLHLHALEQIPLMGDLNRAVRGEFDGAHYATMVAFGWHARRGLIVMTNAGHPPPLWYRASQNEWAWMETRRSSPLKGPTGVPLGLFPNPSYDRLIVKPECGDLFVLYTDGVCEASTPAGVELGCDGLMNIARELSVESPERFGTELASALRAFRGNQGALDDETFIVLAPCRD
ncbi:MAG TPA: PP2C family protein-serine/threonine phosphatase [Bryobacteraceae bacterium]|nr:PP2C family protein-serine/threonine phosphatase [Bryobacteraceae bacterium]